MGRQVERRPRARAPNNESEGPSSRLLERSGLGGAHTSGAAGNALESVKALAAEVTESIFQPPSGAQATQMRVERNAGKPPVNPLYHYHYRQSRRLGAKASNVQILKVA